MNKINGKILTPGEYQTAFGPLVFIAAPWRRGFQLQTCAVTLLARYAGKRYMNVAHTQMPQERYLRLNELEKWQQFYMERAYKKGSILFWLPTGGDLKADERLPVRYLLGKWLSQESRPRITVVLNPGAANAEALKRDILAVNPAVVVTNSLKFGCQQAVRIAMAANLGSGINLPEKDWTKSGPGFYPEGVSTAEIDAAWDDIVAVENVYRLERRIHSPEGKSLDDLAKRKIALGA